MSGKQSLIVGALIGTAALAIGGVDRGVTSVRRFDNVLGTSMELKVRATSDAAAALAEAAVLAVIDHDAKILSGYDASSEFSRWFQTLDSAQPVSPELFDILQRFDRWRERTHGALDASAEAASRIWRAAAAAHRLPTVAEIGRTIAAIRRPHWRLDAARHTATHLDDTPLILNSFTKSYIVDRAAAAGLATGGVRGIIVNIGGDLVARGRWREVVSITNPAAPADNDPPLTQLAIADRAVATSGGYRRGFDIDGVHYSHIVDPRTGRPTGHVLSATVVAPAAADAGALATAFCVLAPEESEAVAATVPGAEFLLVLADGRTIVSAGWRDLVVPRPGRLLPDPVATLHASEQGTWTAGYELTISLEIAQQPFRANRPYVAVWIEDKTRAPVRTLAVWYHQRESRYLSDLRTWFRSERDRRLAEGTDLLGSVSGATRGPGKYTLTWDGKDNNGKLVNAGHYVVCIEAAREHGTYQIIRQELDFSGAAARVTLPGNVEIASASLDYHRVIGK